MTSAVTRDQEEFVLDLTELEASEAAASTAAATMYHLKRQSDAKRLGSVSMLSTP